ncbi:MAG: hypothetical protein ACQ9MH_14340 [Nitrospinales bacterium]
MITKNSFVKQFDQLSASFNRAMTAKHLDAWYAEVEHRDPRLFLKACHKLKYGERFPNFATFRAAYQEAQASRDQGKPARQNGCKWCHDKLVIWEDGDYTRSGRCRYCYPEGEVNVIDPKKIDRDPKLNLIKPMHGEEKEIPREALQELMGFISNADFMDSGQAKSGNRAPQVKIDRSAESEVISRKLRAKNLARDKARDGLAATG